MTEKNKEKNGLGGIREGNCGVATVSELANIYNGVFTP